MTWDYLVHMKGVYRRRAARAFCRRMITIGAGVPFVSFTFDDFPRSALLNGGAILKRFDARGTFYASFGLMGKEDSAGPVFLRSDVSMLLQDGHELGCHTYSHCDAAATRPSTFVESVIQNKAALQEVSPGAIFRTFSYPKNLPRVSTKRRVARQFICCRGGGQTFNAGRADLNCLSAFFLEQSADHLERIKEVIEENRRARGWLVFATHDVAENPSKWGCTPELFESVVRYAVDSGARILPVAEVYDALRSVRSPGREQAS